MRRLARILRIIPLAFVCAMFASAALRVQAERTAAEGQTSLPSRIGDSHAEESFLQATLAEMGIMALEVGSLILPGVAPPVYVQPEENPFSLDALKSRTRNQAHGSRALNF